VRATQDADITLLCPFGSEPAAVDRLLAGFKARIAGAREFALRQRRTLDWRLIVEELKPLLDLRETPGHMAKLQQLRSKVEKGA